MDPKTRREFLELLEAEHRAGYAEGYAAAKREVVLGAETLVAPPVSPKNAVAEEYRTARQVTRGVTVKMIETHMATANPKRDLGNFELIREIKASTGIKLSETSVARAMRELAERGIVQRVPNTKAWRYVFRPQIVGGEK
jgi:hypothetical protein